MTNSLLMKVLSMEDAEVVREWRNTVSETLRTPHPLSFEQQQQYYKDVICDRRSTTRYFGFWDDETFIGYGGIENIIFEYGIGEISLIVNPNEREKGYGRQIVNLILSHAFNSLGLKTVFGECYLCANIDFWTKIINERKAYHTFLPRRKFYNGQLWDSIYFSFCNDGPCEVKE
jgi:RimJ/RimL family protein N-acetyltransferase